MSNNIQISTLWYHFKFYYSEIFDAMPIQYLNGDNTEIDDDDLWVNFQLC